MQLKRITDLIPTDKLFHFMLGALIAFPVGFWFNPVATLCAVLAVGILKELWDFFTKTGTVEGLDVLATILGGIVAISIFWLYKLYPHTIV